MQVTLLLSASGALTGGLTGLVAGTAWAVVGLGSLGPRGTALVIAAALVADVAARRSPRFRPFAVARQVPVVWGAVFGARLTATLYGARLGAGPLTILRTWTWWAALLVGASLGPWPSAGVGVVFALTRALTTVLAVRGAASGVVMHQRVAVLDRTEPAVITGTTGLLAVAAIALTLA